jgi:L-amino acid N-acyltransferase YncA
MITYQVERWNDIVDELAEWFPKHWAELAVTKEAVPLDVDFIRYKYLDDNGVLHLVTIRMDGELIGYYVSVLNQHLHYKSTPHAFCDIYYVDPAHRNGRVGLKLFLVVEEEMKKLGIKKIITSCKVSHDHSRMFEALGYENTDILFAKIL